MNESVDEGTNILKSGLSTYLKDLGFNKQFSDDIGSAAIDGISFYLMKKGGEKSSKIGGKASVQSLKNTARQ